MRGGAVVPNSAVPVFAIGAPGRSARSAPLPPVTTPRMRARRVAASAGVTGRVAWPAVPDGTPAAGTTNRGTTGCPATTLAVTVAMPRGLAVISPWPIIWAAWSVWPVAAGTPPRWTGRPTRGSELSPRPAAASARAADGALPRSPMKAVLQLLAKDVASGTCPSPAAG